MKIAGLRNAASCSLVIVDRPLKMCALRPLYTSPKRWYTATSLHVAIYHKAVTFKSNFLLLISVGLSQIAIYCFVVALLKNSYSVFKEERHLQNAINLLTPDRLRTVFLSVQLSPTDIGTHSHYLSSQHHTLLMSMQSEISQQSLAGRCGRWNLNIRDCLSTVTNSVLYNSETVWWIQNKLLQTNILLHV